MGWRAETGMDMLQHIVVLLLSLADLADHAASRSPAMRRQVMWSFWEARAVVAEFVTASADHATSSPVAGAFHHGDDPADALALAVSLRWLALVVHGMAARQRRLSRTHPGSASRQQGHANVVVIQSLLSAATSLPETRDTS